MPETMLVRPLETTDYSEWLALWDGYNAFYKRDLPSEITKIAWTRFLDPAADMFALVAVTEGRVVGLVHFLFHLSTSLPTGTCYLQDLYTLETSRGLGVGRALIEAVYEKAKERGAARVYWQTHELNETARSLYDKLADDTGFVVYRKQF
jgi:GNAT superfamily N-acetyltransferase